MKDIIIVMVYGTACPPPLGVFIYSNQLATMPFTASNPESVLWMNMLDHTD